MDIRKLARIDLNLLISLQVLLEEKSVSKAAKRLNITQPAMSKTLTRLRQVFADPLFTRSSHGMQPTPRAVNLADDLGNILSDITQLASSETFDPSVYTGEITLALSEYIGVSLLPPLIKQLHQLAPRLSIRTITRVENQLEKLSQGQLDFAIHIERSHYSSDFVVAPIGENSPALLVRKDHPLTRGAITWRRLANYPVIQLYISDMDQAEMVQTSETFRRIRHPQQGSLETSHLLTALEVLRSTDYFMPGPIQILDSNQFDSSFVGLPLPEGEAYSMKYMLVAHHRTIHSAMHRWLWDNILAIAEQQRPATEPANAPWA